MARRSVSLIRISLFIAAVLLLFARGAGSGPASAADFTVDSTADAVDATPGDGVCDDGAGNCTLRAAIQETNALPGGDTISLPAGTYTLTIPGTDEDAAATGDLDITDDLTITGASPAVTIIDGNGEVTGERVFHVDPSGSGINATITNVVIRGGDDSSGFGGAGALSGGGTLTLTNCGLGDNTTTQSGGALRGIGSAAIILTSVAVGGNTANNGIINSQGSLSMTNSSISGNTAYANGGGIESSGTLTLADVIIRKNSATASGGGIMNSGSATLTNVFISVNLAGTGGGINNSGTLTLTNSAVGDNWATNFGGGIYNEGDALSLTDSSISYKTAGADGSGIWNGGQLTVTNSTITGNQSVAFDSGGGIWNVGSVDLTNVTIANNTADPGAGIYNPGGTVSMLNTIVAGNTGGDCDGLPPTSVGHNLDRDGTCGFTGPGDLSGIDPKLGPLADNGGPTPTHALLAGSPAIDAGDNDGCPATDQRGVARPIDGDGDGTATCDIGAYEYEPPVTPTPTPTPTATPTATPAELPLTGGEPGSSGGVWTLAIVLLAAGVLGLAGAGGALVAARRR